MFNVDARIVVLYTLFSLMLNDDKERRQNENFSHFGPIISDSIDNFGIHNLWDGNTSSVSA